MLQIDVSRSYWAVDSPRAYAQLFDALDGWLPDGSTLYFEGGSPGGEIEAFMTDHAAPEPIAVAPAAAWPPPRTFHVAVAPAVLGVLAQLSVEHPEAQLAAHFHVYHEAQIILAAYDLLAQEIWLPSSTAKARVADLAARLGVTFRKAS